MYCKFFFGNDFAHLWHVPIQAIEIIDGQVGRVLKAIEARSTRGDEEWLIAMTTDHGGEGTSHGALNDACRTI